MEGKATVRAFVSEGGRQRVVVLRDEEFELWPKRQPEI